MRIAISPDENPGDPGTTADPTITERDLNVKVATALQNALMRCGQDAWFDASITFVERVGRANSDGTTLLAACAHNAGGGEGSVFVFCPGGHATQTPTWSNGAPNRQDVLARNLGSALVRNGISSRFITLDESIYECCSFQFDTLYTEYLFMDSAHDQAIYHAPDYPVRAAEVTAQVIAATYGFAYVPPTPPPPTPPPAPVPTDAQALAIVAAIESDLAKLKALLAA